MVTLTCSVSMYEQCPYTVKWLYEDKPIDKNNKGLQTSQSACSASVTFTTSHNVYTSKNYDLFKCQVKNDDDDNIKEFTFRIQLPGMKTGENMVVF
ncbi:unnamed protein product [Oreochromis niloticus]|nr:unnamed protein product [Mustela putorius furo]